MVQAREAMDRRDYAAAVPLLRDALARHPTDLEVHYHLGVSTSHLDQVDEARREFEWVVAHGEPDAPEVQIAREWLASRTPATVSAPSVPSATEGGRAARISRRQRVNTSSGVALAALAMRSAIGAAASATRRR